MKIRLLFISFPIDSSKHYNAGMSLKEIMITPDNTELSTVQYDDLPYVGYLSLSSLLFEWDKNSFNEYHIEIGIMGKYSGAEFVQKKFHKMIGSKQPQGLDTQLYEIPTPYIQEQNAINIIGGFEYIYRF